MGQERQRKVGYYPIFIAGKAIPAVQGASTGHCRLCQDYHKPACLPAISARLTLRCQ